MKVEVTVIVIRLMCYILSFFKNKSLFSSHKNSSCTFLSITPYLGHVCLYLTFPLESILQCSPTFFNVSCLIKIKEIIITSLLHLVSELPPSSTLHLQVVQATCERLHLCWSMENEWTYLWWQEWEPHTMKLAWDCVRGRVSLLGSPTGLAISGIWRGLAAFIRSMRCGRAAAGVASGVPCCISP